MALAMRTLMFMVSYIIRLVYSPFTPKLKVSLKKLGWVKYYIHQKNALFKQHWIAEKNLEIWEGNITLKPCQRNLRIFNQKKTAVTQQF